MLTVHKIPLKNRFLTGIGSRYDKTPTQNEPQPFTSLSFTRDCTIGFLGKESCQRMTDNFNRTGILYNTSKKQDIGLMLCTRDFDATRTRNTDFEYGASKSDGFMLIFNSCGSCHRTK